MELVKGEVIKESDSHDETLIGTTYRLRGSVYKACMKVFKTYKGN